MNCDCHRGCTCPRPALARYAERLLAATAVLGLLGALRRAQPSAVTIEDRQLLLIAELERMNCGNLVLTPTSALSVPPLLLRRGRRSRAGLPFGPSFRLAAALFLRRTLIRAVIDTAALGALQADHAVRERNGGHCRRFAYFSKPQATYSAGGRFEYAVEAYWWAGAKAPDSPRRLHGHGNREASVCANDEPSELATA
jgi:hypothetical protein